jgi:hypothetical protein
LRVGVELEASTRGFRVRELLASERNASEARVLDASEARVLDASEARVRDCLPSIVKPYGRGVGPGSFLLFPGLAQCSTTRRVRVLLNLSLSLAAATP